MIISLVMNIGGSITHWSSDLLTGFGCLYHRTTTSRVAKSLAKAYADGFSRTVQDLMMPLVVGQAICLVWHCDNFVTRVGKAKTHLKAGVGTTNVYICYTLQGLASRLRQIKHLLTVQARRAKTLHKVMPGFLFSGVKDLNNFWTSVKDVLLPKAPSGCESKIILGLLAVSWVASTVLMPICIDESHLSDYYPVPSQECKSSSFAHYEIHVLKYIEALTTNVDVNLMKDGYLVVCHDIGNYLSLLLFDFLIYTYIFHLYLIIYCFF